MTNDKVLTKPANMSLVNGIITATDVHEHLIKNDRTLYERRFGIGRDHDYNEFSASLERRGLLPISPYTMTIQDICNNSEKNNDIIHNIIASRIEDRCSDNRFTDEPMHIDSEYLLNELSLSYDYAIDDYTKLDNRTNIDIIDILTDLQLYEDQEFSYRTKFNDNRYISLNQVTFLQNAYTSNSNLEKLNRTRRLGELLNLIVSPKLKNVRKENRPQIYYTSNGIRPDNTQYHKWNGMQVFDLDMKNADCFDNIKNNISEIRDKLYESLKHYHWLVGVGLSSSGNGIHIYTKVARPHQYYINEMKNEEYIKYWYRMSYIQKYAAIKYIMHNICNIDNGSNQKHPVIDFAVGKISQGIRVSYDPNFKINDNFEDIQPCVNYHVPPLDNISINDWLLCDDIVNNKTFIFWMSQFVNAENIINGSYAPATIAFGDTDVILPEGATIRPYNGDVYYQLRYNVCNTIAAYFGEGGRNYAHTILRSSECRNTNEINGIYNCALSTNKTPSKYGLQILSECGFSVSIGEESKKLLIENAKTELVSLIKKSAYDIVSDDYTIKLSNDEYLGDRESELLKLFRTGSANLLYSPPGTGKTELVKTLSKKYRVLLVLPYISVIDAKVIRDNDLGDTFDAYYGNAKVSDIKKGKSAVMTLDKFGRIDIDAISYMFDYIMIDESHLLFTSSFRLEAMANSLKNIKNLITISKHDEYASKVVMMTGTPTGEIAYFDFYGILNEIKVHKEEDRKKQMNFIICDNNKDMQAKIAIDIAESLKCGKKILYPTNSGDVQAAKLIGMIEHHLGRSIKWSYYKKANSNSEMSVSINEHATVGDYELILASNYLSVGIDIKDIGEFECIYDSSFAAYEIEQFNCRLRKIDIISRVYIPVYDNENNIHTNLLNYSNYSIKMSRGDRDLLRDYVDISNKKLELSVSYDPITNRIFTPGFRIENGQIIFKLEEHELVMFEERFLETMRCPYFIAKQLNEYGYEINVEGVESTELSIINELIKVGLINAKIEAEYKNDLSLYSFNWLLDNDTYMNSYDMEYPNLINRIWKESIEIIEDPDANEIFVNESIIGDVVSITVPDRRIFDEQLSIASRFVSLYSINTSKHIYGKCVRKTGRINKAEVSRYMRLMQLVKMEERGSLGPEINELIKYMYTYIDEFMDSEDKYVTSNDHELRVDYCTQLYLSRLGIELRSAKMIKKYRDEVNELINVLCKRTTTDKMFRFEFRMLPTPDNATRQKLIKYDSILKKMFDISDDKLPQELQDAIRLRHVTKNDMSAANIIKKIRSGNKEILDNIIIE